MHKFALATAVACALAAPAAANAATIVQQFGTEFTGVLGFNSSLGTLTGVAVSVTTTSEASYDIQTVEDAVEYSFASTHYVRYNFDFPDIDETASPYAPSVPTLGTVKRDIAPFAGSRSEFVGLVAPWSGNLHGLGGAADAALFDFFTVDGVIAILPEQSPFGAELRYKKSTGVLGSTYYEPTQSYFAYQGTVTYTFDTLAAAVPETKTWTLLIISFGALGAAMRRQRMAHRPGVAVA